MRLDGFDASAANALFDALKAEAKAVVESGASGRKLEERRTAYMRYVGQGHEIVVPVPARTLAVADTKDLRAAFEREYAALFQRIIPEGAIEILSWTLTLSTSNELPKTAAAAPKRDGAKPIGSRQVFDAATEAFAEVPVYARTGLAAGHIVSGPALIVEDETTTFLSARFDARIDSIGSIVLERRS
jgi:N-methylhydantoinase A